MSLVRNQGPLNWVKIAQLIGSRTPKQCRERYHQNLKPTLNHDPITPEEGVQIDQMVREIGKRWAEIARRLDGRSDNAVKNWWNGNQNRRKRQDRRHKPTHMSATTIYEAYEVRTDMMRAAYHHNATIGIPRTLPHFGSGRQLPPPPLSVGFQDRNYGVETPLPSPAGLSPESEGGPSPMSDASSHYAISPRPYSIQPPVYQLPPLKTEGFHHPSPRSSSSPTERTLPSLSAITSPTFDHSEPYRSLDPMAPRSEHFLYQSQLPTAPNSPVGSPEARLPKKPVWGEQESEKPARISVAALLG